MNRQFRKALGEILWNQAQPLWVLNDLGDVLAVNPELEQRFQTAHVTWNPSRVTDWLVLKPAMMRETFLKSEGAPKEKASGNFPADLVITQPQKQTYQWCWQRYPSENGEALIACWGAPVNGAAQQGLSIPEDHELLGKILDHSIDGMITIDTKGCMLSFNVAAERLFGYAPEEVLGKNVSMLMPSPHREQHDDYLKAYLETGLAKIIGKGREVLGLRKNGTKFPFLLTTTKPFQIGETLGFLGIVRDLSQTKNIESQLRNAQKMESIGTLAGGIAHDFNNILGGISGYIELMLEDALPGSTFQEDLFEMKRACLRGRDLVLQILTFSRRDRTTFAPMHLQPIIKESLKLLRATLPATIKVTEDISPTCPPIFGDVTQIHQVLMNLGTNAFHAMRRDGGTLTITLEKVHFDQDYLGPFPNLPFGPYNRLQVKDTGHGIKPEHLSRIFDPFFTTKAVGDGTGMGLAMVHGIIQSHQGEVTVESELGEGSCFCLFFPAHIEEPEEKVEKTVQPSQQGREHLVLVDDDPMLLRVQSRILRKAGYQVSPFAKAKEALAAMLEDKAPFDLLLTDQTMPDMTGLDLAKAVLSQNPRFPVILTTGFSESVSPESIQEFGIQALLMKPVGKADLTDAIRRVLDRQKA